MSLKILTNTVWGQAAELRYLDNTTKLNSTVDQYNVTAGALHLDYNLVASTTQLNVDYINKDAILDYDTVVIARADLLAGFDVKIIGYTSYTASSFNHLSTGVFAETLYGIDSDIYVRDTTADGIGDEGLRLQVVAAPVPANYKINKFYGCKSVTIDNAMGLQRELLPRGSKIVLCGEVYEVEERYSITLPWLDDSTIQQINNLYKIKEGLFFIWDTTGAYINERIIPCILAGSVVVKVFNDLHIQTLEVFRVRSYFNTWE